MMNCVVVHCLATTAYSVLLCCTLCFNLSPPTIVLFMVSGNHAVYNDSMFRQIVPS